VSWARLTTPATVISHCGSFVLSMSVLLVAMLLPEAIEGARWLRRRRPDARSRGPRRADLGGGEPQMTGSGAGRLEERLRAPVGEDDTVALEHAVELAPVRPRRAEERQHPLVELRREPDLGSERYDGIPARPRCLGELHERLRHPGRDGHLRANGTLR